jgi:molybdopterin molybdotransferase
VRENIPYSAARAAILASVSPLPSVLVQCSEALGYFLSQDIVARVASPTQNASMRDGYAVAEPTSHDEWRVTQTVVAGVPSTSPLRRGEAARIFTGGELPTGTIGIIPEEQAFRRGGTLTAEDGACTQRFILSAGSDVGRGDLLATAGTRVRPALAGLLVAGGCDEIEVHAKPRVGLVATGDELVLPGQPLLPGQLYASNAVVVQNWLSRFGMECVARTCVDDREELQRTVAELLPNVDAIVTSGGAWKSERDHTLAAFGQLGWEPTYRMARLAPGKATAHGVLGGKPVFCLPGGPPANELTFLLLALPALQRMAGGSPHPLPTVYVTLTAELSPTPGWTRIHQLQLAPRRPGWTGTSVRPLGRMHGPAKADALVLHDSDEPMAAGSVVEALLLSNPESPQEE